MRPSCLSRPSPRTPPSDATAPDGTDGDFVAGLTWTVTVGRMGMRFLPDLFLCIFRVCNPAGLKVQISASLTKPIMPIKLPLAALALGSRRASPSLDLSHGPRVVYSTIVSRGSVASDHLLHGA